MVVRINESDLRCLIKESLMEALGEGIDSSVPKLIHIAGYMHGLNEDGLKDILTTGLKCHDNGEIGKCIWFSVGDKFADKRNLPLVVSLDATEENIKRFGLDRYDIEAGAAHTPCYRDIPIEYLNIEELMWGYSSNDGTFAKKNMLSGGFANSRMFGDFRNWVRFDKGFRAIIYEDLFDMWAKETIASHGGENSLEYLKELMGDRIRIERFF